MTMNKSEMIDRVTEIMRETHKSAIRKQDVNLILQVLTMLWTDALAKGDVVRLPDFGTFRSTVYAARKGVNFATGGSIDLPASRRVHFTSSKALKEAVKQ